MASSHRPNRFLAPSLRGQRAVDAEEQRMREQILRENAKAFARKAASEQNKSTNTGGEQSFQQPPSK